MKNKITKTIQEAIPIEALCSNGLIKTEAGFIKCFHINDINQTVQDDEDQLSVLDELSTMLNTFSPTVSFTFCVRNKKMGDSEIKDNYLIKESDSQFDLLTKEYNSIVENKIVENGSDVTKVKYLVVCVNVSTEEEATRSYLSVTEKIIDSFAKMSRCKATALNSYELSELLFGIMQDGDFAKCVSAFVKDNDLSADLIKKRGTTLNNLLSPRSLSKTEKYLILNDKVYASSFLITAYPLDVASNIVSELSSCPFEMLTSVHLNPLSLKESIKKAKIQNNSIKGDLAKAQKDLASKMLSEDLLSEELVQAKEEAKDIRNRVVVNREKLINTVTTITVFADSEEELKNRCEIVAGKIESFSLMYTPCKNQQLLAFVTSLPLGVVKVDSDILLTASSCRAFSPFNVMELMDKRGFFYGLNAISNNPIIYDRKKSDLANGLIFGRAGMGKSFIVKGAELVPLRLAYPKDKIIILDPENEYSVVGRKFGALQIDLSTTANQHINPCDLNMEWNDKDANPLAEKCDFMVGLVESMLGENKECNAYQLSAIHRATEVMYKDYVTTMENRYRQGDTRDVDFNLSPTLEDFYKCLLADNTPEAEGIAMSIEPFCIGQYNIFSHKTNVDTNNNFIIYNLLNLPAKMKNTAMKVCLSNIWTDIVKNREKLEEDKRNGVKDVTAVRVYLDEFHLFLSSNSSAETIKTYFKRDRKYNGIITGLTQDVSDLLQVEAGSGIFNNTGFYVILSQSRNGIEQWMNILQCSEKMADYIKERPQGCGLIYNNKSLVPFDYSIPKATELYKLISTNPNDERENRNDNN